MSSGPKWKSGEVQYYLKWGNLPDYTYPYRPGTKVRILCDVVVESEAGDVMVGLKGCEGIVYKWDLVKHQDVIYRIPSEYVELWK